jgi:WD40 repeat protein
VPKAGSQRAWDGHLDWVVACAFAPDGSWAVTGGRDRTLRLWDPARGAVTAVLEGHTGTPDACDVLPNGPVIASASGDETLVWLRHEHGEVADIVGRMPGSEITCFSHDARYLLLAQRRALVLLDLHQAEEAMRYEGHEDTVTCGCFSADDRFVVSGSRDRTLKVWDRETGAERATLAGHTDIVTGCAISPDARFVASASWDRTVRLWDLTTGLEPAVFTGHTLSCTCCAFTHDGRTVVSGSSDTTVRAWDVAAGTGRTIFYTLGCIECLAFSPDGRWLGVGDWGGNAYLLAVEGGV